MKFPAERPENFCILPFKSIRQNAFGQNSPCAFGAGEWQSSYESQLKSISIVENSADSTAFIKFFQLFKSPVIF
jgi:hypothetical protein